MNKKNLILTGLGLYILGYNIYYNDESRSIPQLPQPVNILRPNLEIPNLEIPNLEIPNISGLLKLPNKDECCGQLIYSGKAYKSILIKGNSAYIEGMHGLDIDKDYEVCVISTANNIERLIYKGTMTTKQFGNQQYLIAPDNNDFVTNSGIVNARNSNYLPVDVKYTKPCDCNCKVKGWETDFTDLEINNEFIINEFIKSVNKFKLQVIPSPFSITNGVRIKQTNCGKKTNNNNNRELEVNNAFLILFNNDNLDYDNSYGVKKLCYEFCLLGGKNYLLITSGNNFSLEDINNYPEIPFEGCKINILDQGNGSKKVIIESDNCLDVVAVYGQELFINNLKYCLDKCDQ